MIHVIAIITAKRGQRDSVVEVFLANVPAVKAEPGCIEYEATVDGSPGLKFQTEFGPDTFVVVEKWGECGGLGSPFRCTAHGDLRVKDQGHDRQPCDPRLGSGLKLLCEPRTRRPRYSFDSNSINLYSATRLPPLAFPGGVII